MRTRFMSAVMVLAVGLLVAGCVVTPAGPPRVVYGPGYWAHGPWGPYWMEPHWRYVP